MFRFLLIAAIFAASDIADLIKRKEYTDIAIYAVFMAIVIAGGIYAIR